MNKKPNVVIVIVKCASHKKLYGIRFEEITHNNWSGTWAFSIKEEAAKKEGYDKGRITGNFSFALNYPGCPYCFNKGFFQCSCDKINCWNGQTMTVQCSWCGCTGEMAGSIQSISSGGDR